MSDRCEIPAGNICWTPPTDILCDPCLDLDNPDDVEAFNAAWRYASSFVYGRTCRRWPGSCFTERVRPCLPRCSCRRYRSCSCGVYQAVNLADAFCLPVIEITEVEIVGGDCCPCQDTEVWTPESGHYRLEWDGNCPILVRQRAPGEDCCEWWPQQDLCNPDGGACTWSVTARTGCDPPPDVLAGTGHLALSIVKECQQRGCSPAAGARRVTTRGATYERDDDDLGSGLWWDILESAFKTWACTPTRFERFAAPGNSTAPTFHTVFGPTVAVDCSIVVAALGDTTTPAGS